MTTYIVTAWKADNRYHAKDANGARVFKRESAARRFCDEMNQNWNASATLQACHPGGYVIRDNFATNGVEITAAGRIY